MELETTSEEEISEETQEYSPETSELTEADFYKEQSRREKAEKALVELKKQLKAQKATSPSEGIDVKSIIKEELELEKFFSKNEEALLYKDKIMDYKSKGLSLSEAYTLASSADREIDNNRAYSESSVVGKQSTSEGLSLVSIKEFDKMSSSAQQEYMDNCKAKKGKVTFK